MTYQLESVAIYFFADSIENIFYVIVSFYKQILSLNCLFIYLYRSLFYCTYFYKFIISVEKLFEANTF